MRVGIEYTHLEQVKREIEYLELTINELQDRIKIHKKELKKLYKTRDIL